VLLEASFGADFTHGHVNASAIRPLVKTLGSLALCIATIWGPLALALVVGAVAIAANGIVGITFFRLAFAGILGEDVLFFADSVHGFGTIALAGIGVLLVAYGTGFAGFLDQSFATALVIGFFTFTESDGDEGT